MNLLETKLVTIEHFHKIREKSERLLEFIDGIIYMSPSPSTKHQRISGKIYAKLFYLLEGKDCEVFSAPYDIQLHHKNIKNDKVVIPDIAVICDKEGLGENKYLGVPTLIVEIISPSNQAMDLVVKLNLYMKYGVKEYWIVNPLINTIQVYALNKSNTYDLIDVIKGEGTIHSKKILGFEIDSKKLFEY